MAKRKKSNPIVVLRGKKCSVFPSDNEARPMYAGVSGALFYKCGSIENGMKDLMLFQQWERLAPEFAKRNLKANDAKEIIASMVNNQEQFITEQLAQVQSERLKKAGDEERQRNAPTMAERSEASSIKANEQAWARIQAENERKKKYVVQTCLLGVGGNDSIIDSSNGYPKKFKTSVGAKTAQMYLELGYAALKLADNHINQGADTVEILGLNASVGNTLNNFAPNWKANGWVNSSGKSPANLELVQSMLELYEQMEGKVTLGDKKPKAAHTDDLPF
ncbi:MAG: ribonuclease HI [Cocleimonas sp.]|jgi:ribonuclease HI